MSALAGCGGLSNPDFTTGEVTGRVTGAVQTGAFAYVLGSPETRVPIAADGSYTLHGVPVGDGTARIVLYDGGTHADTHDVQVKPAARSYAADRDVGTLALARTVFVAARCMGGISGAKTTYGVEGAALGGDAIGDTAILYPLPPGKFRIYAALPGLYVDPIDVDVTTDASVQIEFDMDLDEDDDQRGCGSNACLPGLYCDADNGQCYQCVTDDQCGSGQHCINYACTTDTWRAVCASCDSASQCSPGSSQQAALCIPAPGGAGGNVCSHACATSADCPSGYACQSTADGMACVPPQSASCAALTQAFGKACFTMTSATTPAADCAPLDTPTCKRSSGGGSTAGYCTSRCSATADCPTGFECDLDDHICEHEE
jgi:hypothetical protein